MFNDAELLDRYLGHDDEAAFAELVRRHLGLVYSAALRRTGGRSDLAEEIAQKDFSALAQQARSLVRLKSRAFDRVRRRRSREGGVAPREIARENAR